MNPGEAWVAAHAAATIDQRAVMARSLRARTDIDPAQTEYALRPFTPLHDGNRWWLAAITTPCPVAFPGWATWEPDGDVILIDPKIGTMILLGDDSGWLVEPAGLPKPDDAIKLYTNGIVFARDWVAARAAWADGIARNLVPGSIAEPSLQPGVALCGDLGRVVDLMPIHGVKRVVVDNPRMAKPISDALLRHARLPTVESMPARLRAVA